LSKSEKKKKHDYWISIEYINGRRRRRRKKIDGKERRVNEANRERGDVNR